MYRPHRQFLFAFGVLTALAVLGVGPHTVAAYMPVGDTAGSILDDDPDEGPADSSQPDRERDEVPAPKALSNGIGGMASPGSGSGAGPVPAAGYLPPTRPPEPELVVYFREPPASPWPFLLIDSLLDPPRPA